MGATGTVSAATSMPSMPSMPFLSSAAGHMPDMADIMSHTKVENNSPIGTGEHIPLYMTHSRISSAESGSPEVATMSLKTEPTHPIEITPQITAS